MIIIISQLLVGLLCASITSGYLSLKQRVNTLEIRANTLEMRVNTDNALTRAILEAVEQDVELINSSLVLLEGQVCTTEGNVDNIRKVNKVRAESTKHAQPDIFHLSKTILTAGLADEKKWLRNNVEEFENKIRESETFIKSEMNSYETEINALIEVRATEVDDKLKDHEHDVTNKLNSFENVIDSFGSKLNGLETWKNVTKEEIKKDISLLITALYSEVKMIKESITSIGRKLAKSQECLDGWTSFGSYCYLYVRHEKTYHSAREECSLTGATVADIESQTEQDFILPWCVDNGHAWKGNDELWIGLTDEQTEGKWISDRTRTKAVYTNWGKNQPDGHANQNCVLIGWAKPYDKWYDRPCSGQAAFVCKKRRAYNV